MDDQDRKASGYLGFPNPVPHSVLGNKFKICINVSGHRFELLRTTLTSYPQTRLGRIATLPGNTYNITEDPDYPLYDHYDAILREYYFQRNPACFPLVISYYVNNLLHVPRHMCSELFQEEMEYWGIPFNLTNCCQGFHRQEWEISEGVRLTNQLFERQQKKSICEPHTPVNVIPKGRYKRWKIKIWNLFENSDSSKAASVSYRY